jgi:hypothetical protein
MFILPCQTKNHFQHEVTDTVVTHSRDFVFFVAFCFFDLRNTPQIVTISSCILHV